MKTFKSTSYARLAAWFALSTATLLTVSAADPTLTLDHHSYLPSEPIIATFSNGPGNAKDWIGIYPDGVTPGPNSTIWRYVDGTDQGKTGVSEGTVTLTEGLSTPGDWRAFLLLNDTYTSLADVGIRVADPTLPFVRPLQSVYVPKEPITLFFTNGPGNATDWIGLYRAGITPSGNPPSIDWRYVGGTQSAGEPKTEGTITITAGLPIVGDYVAFFLAQDGYSILSSEPFSVAENAATIPRILSVSPIDGATGQGPSARLTILIKEGTYTVREQTITLKVDGSVVKAGFARSGDQVTISYQPDQLFPPLSPHEFALSFLDTATPADQVSFTNRFVVGAWKNLVLPTPLYFEDFEKTDEGSLPAGWTSESYSEVKNPDLDLGNLDSASYANWVVVDSGRFKGPLVTYSNPATTTTDYQRVLNPNPLNVVNGKSIVVPMIQGHAVFADSGYRNGRGQVLYLYTPDFDLTGKKDIRLAFHSAWEQNQDSMAAVEYSIDQGLTWLPVSYFLDAPDIVRVTDEATGFTHIDVEATFTTSRNDIATYLDENGDLQGGTYGAFIRAPISDALAPYIQARPDDDAVGSKRVESFRVVAADNQPKVRFRFAHAGTDSWYWGLDDIGIYSVPSEKPQLSIAHSADRVQVSWSVDFSDFVLESSASIDTPDWKAVPGVTGVSATISGSEAQAYFRLHRP